ncbi:hypothetical protein E2C01_088979 [Portunus trituberculatus]|uniref:Uncharacterized protein n=1 Tax=Portunus trituberculatus TaxID=210409 RepID=A0A5B7JNC0_PORTR|nr:hypothetical protein [Portunus trituberculatus]
MQQMYSVNLVSRTTRLALSRMMTCTRRWTTLPSSITSRPRRPTGTPRRASRQCRENNRALLKMSCTNLSADTSTDRTSRRPQRSHPLIAIFILFSNI